MWTQIQQNLENVYFNSKGLVWSSLNYTVICKFSVRAFYTFNMVQVIIRNNHNGRESFCLLRLCFLESWSMSLVGSEPMDRKQIIGTRMFDSFHISSIFRITPSAYFTPIDSEMYFSAWGKTRSGHHDLKTERHTKFVEVIGINHS